jgi:hypothetical protein
MIHINSPLPYLGPQPDREREFSGKPGCTMALQKYPAKEVVAGLALIPLLATVSYYLLPDSWQADRLFQFAPQISVSGRVAIRISFTSWDFPCTKSVLAYGWAL